MQRVAVLLLPLALVAASLTGCGLFGGSSTLEDGLEVVPGSATRVVFVDRAAIAERFEVDDVGSDADADEIDGYLDASREFPLATVLDGYLAVMQDESPFTALDVEWEVTGFDGDGAFGRAWKMRNDLDLDDVGDDLVADGFDEGSARGDARSFTIEPERLDPVTDAHLAAMREITIVPDEHLVITGPLADEVLDVVDDDADSAVDTGAFEDLVGSTDDVEVADLARDDDVCTLAGARLGPEQLTASGVEELGHPDQTGFLIHGDNGDARSVLAFADAEAAEEDAQAREDFLADGRSPVSGVPYSEFGDWELETDGDQVLIDIDYDDPQDIPAVISRGDYLSVCPPTDGG